MATTKIKPIHIFVPFTKIERRAEDDALIVEGYAFVNEVVGGENGIRLKRSAMEAATPEYMKFGAVREMHQPIAAGTALTALWDATGCMLRSECVDPVAKLKIERGVYKGYSVGVNPRVMRGKDVEECEWPETSYVDRPKDPDALFLHRADGFDPEQEIEVEVLDDPAASPHAEEVAPPVASSTGAAGVETPALEGGNRRAEGGTGQDLPDPPSALRFPISVLPDAIEPASSERTATAEASPAAPDPSGAAGDFSSPEEVDVRVMRAALVRAGTPEDMLDQLDVAAAYERLSAEERAQTTQTVPIRENLEGPRRLVPVTKDAPGVPAPASPKHTPAPPPAIPPGMLPSRKRGHIAVMADGCWGLYRSLDDETVVGVFLDMEDARAALGRYAARERERADKPEGDYGSDAHYADPGYQDDKKPRYPLDTKEHVKAAWSYINQADNASKYSSADLAKVKAKIKAAAEKVGMEISDEAERVAVGDLERVIKHEDGKWCVYSESGKKLGEHDTKEEAVKQLQAVEISKHKDEPGATQPKERAAAVKEAQSAQRTAHSGDGEVPAEALSSELCAVRGEAQVSRSDDREDVTAALTRAQTAEAELARVRSGHEEALQRLATAEARVRTLERAPAAPAVIRFPHALTREFLAQMGGEEDAAVKRLQADLPTAKLAAEEEARASGGRGGPATDHWTYLRSQLREYGVDPDQAPGG